MNLKRDNGWLAIRFKVNGEPRTEYLGLKDNRDNIRLAKRIMAELQTEILAGALTDQRYAERFPKSRHVRNLPRRREYTLREWAEKWLARGSRRDGTPWTRGTAYNYRSIVETHLLSHPVAKLGLSLVTRTDLISWLAALRSNGYKASYVNHLLMPVKILFNEAAADGLVASNPAADVAFMRAPRSDVNPFTTDEVEALLGFVGGWFKNFLALSLFTGLRTGEALALRWEDVDWRNGHIKIRRTFDRHGVRPPKTAGSERDVLMIDVVRSALNAQAALSRLLPSGWVFPSKFGQPRDRSTVEAKHWRPLLVEARMVGRPMYQTRHTYASLSLAAGETIQFVASQLGHTTIQMVTQVYGRWLRKPAGGALGEALSHRHIIDTSSDQSGSNGNNRYQKPDIASGAFGGLTVEKIQ